MEPIARPRSTWLRRLLGLSTAVALLACAGCGDAEDAPNGRAPASVAAEALPAEGAGVHVRPVPGVPRLTVGPRNAHGQATQLACSTCHSMKTPTVTQRGGESLRQFHQGLTIQHGNLTCLSCHNAEDYDALRLADGRTLPFTRVMELCAQCHGPQARDYAHGAHGGMSGYWDVTRGKQVRNQCTHCHAPHAPAYPAMRPTFKPRDRFLPPTSDSHDD